MEKMSLIKIMGFEKGYRGKECPLCMKVAVKLIPPADNDKGRKICWHCKHGKTKISDI